MPETPTGLRAFAISAGYDTHSNDATGAFLVGARKFATAFNCSFRTFNNTLKSSERRKDFLKVIEDYCPGNLNLFAYFGHGIPEGMSSANMYVEHIDELLNVLNKKFTTAPIVVLYACSCGRPNKYTTELNLKLSIGSKVFGHTTVGHSFMNPDVSVCGDTYLTGRLLHPYGSELRAPWAEALKRSDLWARFPVMTEEQIAAECNARRLMGVWDVAYDGGGGKHYHFDWPQQAWCITSGRSPGEPPEGTVSSTLRNSKTTTATGVWRICRSLQITWDDGSTESWCLPLQTSGQAGEGISGGNKAYTLEARRLARPPENRLGPLQG